MSIFDNVKNPPISKEIEMLIKLKYGEPNASDEYLDRLPFPVISSAYYKCLMIGVMPENPASQQRSILGIMLRRPVFEDAAKAAIHKALIEYHILKG
jgi:hypothetical protein